MYEKNNNYIIFNIGVVGPYISHLDQDLKYLNINYKDNNIKRYILSFYSDIFLSTLFG